MNSLPQGQAEKGRRSLAMVSAMDEAGFGGCTNVGECEAVCPKNISLDMIAHQNRNYAKAALAEIFLAADVVFHDPSSMGRPDKTARSQFANCV